MLSEKNISSAQSYEISQNEVGLKFITINNEFTIYRPLYTIDPATGNVVQVSGTQYVEYLTNVNGTLYFQGYNSASGYELYRINNTTGNAVLIDVVTGSGSSSPQNFTNVNGTVFFTANVLPGSVRFPVLSNTVE